jgi:CRP/FNR family transcriptional regulator, cyclic AMP receptor protein
MRDGSSLAGVDLFRELSASSLDTLRKNSVLLDCDAGHIFFESEQPGKMLFVLEAGAVRISRTYGERKLTIALLRPPEIFGVIGCFGPGKYSSSAEAVESSRVRIIPHECMQALLESAPQVTRKLVDLMSQRCTYFVHTMETLARKGLIPRLATLLLEKADNGVVAGLTHKHLADHLGLHRESITATLGELRRAGIIAIKRKTIHILHSERLARAAQE